MFEIFMIVTNSGMVFLTSLIASVVIYDKYCKKYKEEKNQEHENHIEIVNNVVKQLDEAPVVEYLIYTKSSNEPSCVLIEEKHENIEEESINQSFLEDIRDDSISLREDFRLKRSKFKLANMTTKPAYIKRY